MDWTEPRSTSSHCGSEKALDHRVPVFPSTAFDAGKLAFSSDEAVAALPCARLAVPQVAAPAGPVVSAVTSSPAIRLSAATMAAPIRWRVRWRGSSHVLRLMTVPPPTRETTCSKTYFKAKPNDPDTNRQPRTKGK